jgi:hypothetical protein
LRGGAKRIDLVDNWIYNNNKPNTAPGGSILSFVPPGTGVLYLSVDDSLIARNRIEDNGYTGIAIADYCLAVLGTPFPCPMDPNAPPGPGKDPSITPEFMADQTADDNTVAENVLIGNGLDAPPPPLGWFKGDLTLLTLLDNGNCYADNVFSTFFSVLGVLPPCD